MNKREARKLGKARGLAAASWVFDGNTTDATYRAFLKGLDEGDPEVMDKYGAQAWLSGEWAGESLTELGLGNATDVHMDIYEEEADLAYWSELERVASYHVLMGVRVRH